MQLSWILVLRSLNFKTNMVWVLLRNRYSKANILLLLFNVNSCQQDSFFAFEVERQRRAKAQLHTQEKLVNPSRRKRLVVTWLSVRTQGLGPRRSFLDARNLKAHAKTFSISLRLLGVEIWRNTALLQIFFHVERMVLIRKQSITAWNTKKMPSSLEIISQP